MKQFKGIVESPTPPPETDVLWMTTIPKIVVYDNNDNFKYNADGPFKIIALFDGKYWSSLIAPIQGFSEPLYMQGEWEAIEYATGIMSVSPNDYPVEGNLLTLPTNASLENVINRVNNIIGLLNNTLNALYSSGLFFDNTSGEG